MKFIYQNIFLVYAFLCEHSNDRKIDSIIVNQYSPQYLENYCKVPSYWFGLFKVVCIKQSSNARFVPLFYLFLLSFIMTPSLSTCPYIVVS